jgi:hypothetical protein
VVVPHKLSSMGRMVKNGSRFRRSWFDFPGILMLGYDCNRTSQCESHVTTDSMTPLFYVTKLEKIGRWRLQFESFIMIRSNVFSIQSGSEKTN